MYFFSETDPNYRVKGSRDPLGFQTLWSAAGHKAVAHLSTVSLNLRDFMILAYAFYFYGDRPENRFLNFFLKFEQVCAYARRIHLEDKAFNGTDFVNKQIQRTGNFSISTSNEDTLLSNQRSYGIYGKYIRPFRDMGMTSDKEFRNVMEQSLSKTDKGTLQKLIDNLLTKDKIEVNTETIKSFSDILGSITPDEQAFYRKYILQVPKEHHAQNNLYVLVNNNRQIAEADFNLHSVVQALQSQPNITADLNTALENIINTDKVLFPLNRCFTHLLGQTSWTQSELNNDEFVNSLPESLSYAFDDDTMRQLNNMLKSKGSNLAEAIIERNEKAKSGGKGWIVKESENFKVVYGENGQKQREVDFSTQYEFPYFLNTWLSLFKQIEMNTWNN